MFFFAVKQAHKAFFKTTTTSALFIHTNTSYSCYVDFKDINSSVAKNMIHAANVRRRSLHVKVWSDEFASNRGDDNPCAQRASLCRTNIASLRDCRQQFSFQLWWSIAQGSESDAGALIQSRSLPLSWHGCLLMTVNFISPLIKRTSSRPSVLPSDAGWEMLSPGIKLRGIQSDLFSPDLYTRRRKRKKKYSAMQYVRAMRIYCSLASQCQTWKHAPQPPNRSPRHLTISNTCLFFYATLKRKHQK